MGQTTINLIHFSKNEICAPTGTVFFSQRIGYSDTRIINRKIFVVPADRNRQQLSYRVCEIYDWRKPNGSLKDMSCRVALLRMHREGLIVLPPPKFKVKPCRSFDRRTAQVEPGSLLEAMVHELADLRLDVVDQELSALWNEYINRYHYLGYKPPGR